MVGSDMHLWPSQATTAHRGFVKLAKLLKPDVIIANGDVIDGASISRHPRIGWEYQPTVKEELDCAKVRLEEIAKAAPKARRYWTLGNHDARFETRLAQVAPEYADIKGIHLRDHFPDWIAAWSVLVNHNTMVKHRWKGGTHAAFNNAKDSGLNVVTGHLHSLNVVAYTDYRGTRFGVDTGTMADINGQQFAYTEDNPLNWRSGFAVLAYHNGDLQWPEVAMVVDEQEGEMRFQGKTLYV